MPIALIITFAILGIALIVLEIFFLPGTTIAGVAGGLFLVASVWVAFASFGSDIGWYTIGAIALMLTVSIYLFVKLGVMDKVSLKTEIDSKLDAKNQFVQVGDRGTASSRLAPMGNADINGQMVEVKSINGFIDVDADIEVVSADKQEILVKQVV